jgi:hypothetical protein
MQMQWSYTKWSRFLKLMLLGGIGFWLPDIILHALRAYDFYGRDVGIITLVSPLAFLVTFFLVNRTEKTFPRAQVVLGLITGVWLFGGFFMMIGATFSGAGFKTGPGDAMIGILLSILPMYTFIMATYDGTLAALLLATVVAFLLWALAMRHPLTDRR